MRVLPSLLSLLLVSPGCFLDYTVGEPSKPDKPGGSERIDRDNDGFTEEEGDCNDDEALQWPGRLEDCDTLDNDCNGIVDWGESELDPCAESVWQRQTLRADVLVVLDVSTTMAPYTARAAAGAVEMIKHLVGKGRDTHIGVVTSDMEEGLGKLVEKQYGDTGVRRFIKGSDDLPLASVWLSQAIVAHELLEDGKEGMRDALHASIVDHTDGWNSGFFRPDAKLSIVLITNEEDSSELGNAELGDTLLEYGGGQDISIHGIIQMEQHCGGLSSSESLLQLIDTTGGLEEDICMEDYRGFMSGVGQTIAQQGLNSEITLPTPAVPETVKIFLQEDGDPRYPWMGDFALSPDGLTVHLLEDGLYDDIPPGVTIQVEYRRVPTPPGSP